MITLEYPLVSPTSTLTIKNPELGNRDILTSSRVYQDTYGGDKIIYSDPVWPKDRILRYTFTELSETAKDDLCEFIDETLGQPFRLIDHNNNYFTVILLTPDAVFTQDAETPCGGRYTVDLEFYVEELEGS